MNLPYQKLPLIDPNAQKVLSNSSMARHKPSEQSILQDAEDAELILKEAGFNISMLSNNIIRPAEKFMVETLPGKANATTATKTKNIATRQKGNRKPHYSHIIKCDNRLIFQAACCLPLKVIAASLDGGAAYGRDLLNRHTEESGGKLVYEFQGHGTKLILNLKRGTSTKAQRIVFSFIP